MTRSALLSAILNLERELLLAPRAARVSGVTMRDHDAPDPDELEPVDDETPHGRRRRGRESISAARRERILRAVT